MNFCSLDTVKIGKTAKILYINCNKIINSKNTFTKHIEEDCHFFVNLKLIKEDLYNE